MRVTLELDVDLTATPTVRVARMDLRPGGQPVGPRELAAIRDWLGEVQPGDYLNVDGTILPASSQTTAPMTTAQVDMIVEQNELILTLLASIDGKLGWRPGGGGADR